jgi:hypothetical protein
MSAYTLRVASEVALESLAKALLHTIDFFPGRKIESFNCDHPHLFQVDIQLFGAS